MSLVQTIARDKTVKKVLESYHEQTVQIIETAIEIQQIPAPTFEESERANYIQRKFQEIGLQDVGQDSIHNVYGRLPGNISGPSVVVTAHSDTVFPRDTDLSVRFGNGHQPGHKIIYGPGLADNALGVAGLITLAYSMMRHFLQIDADLWFVANVCEEGLGDLNGMRAVVDRFGDAATYIVVEGGSYGHVFHRGIGVRRFQLEVETPGGHSWGDYGTPNAVHVLSRIVSTLDELKLPTNHKTTLNVGVIEGGTTVNTIASKAHCLLDLRSTNPITLNRVVQEVEQLIAQTDGQHDIKASMVQIGNRPAGEISPKSKTVVWATDALNQVGCKQVRYMAGSTDANIPISMGLAAVCIGLAKSANTHRLDEFLDPVDLPQGMGQLLLLALAAAGFEGTRED